LLLSANAKEQMGFSCLVAMPIYFTNYPVKSTGSLTLRATHFKTLAVLQPYFIALYLVNPGLDWCMQWVEQEGVAIQVEEE